MKVNDILKLHLDIDLNIQFLNEVEREFFKKYFEKEYQSILATIKNKGSICLPHIFHSILGIKIFGQPTDVDLIQEFLNSCKRNGGYVTTNDTHELFQLLKNENIKVDVYSTYYALLLMGLMDEKTNLDLDIYDLLQPSGLIYSFNISNTKEERRLNSEVIMSNVFGIRLLRIYQQFDKDKLLTNKIYFINNYKSYKYLSALSFIVEVLNIYNYNFTLEDKDYIYDFLNSHYDHQIGGFKEYLFEDVKRDEIRGRLQRFAHDELNPSISATFSALKIIKNFKNEDRFKSLIQKNITQIRVFVNSQQDKETGGYGSPIKIAKMPGFFGSVITPLETLMVISIFQDLKFLED